MMNLTADEQAIVADIKAKYESLSEDGRSVVAKGVSWIESHWFWVAPGIFLIGLLTGWLA